MWRTLVLDQSFQPVDVVSWMEAMRLLVTGKAEVVEEHDVEIRSSTQSWKLPSVLRYIRGMRKRSKRVIFSRRNVFYRDNYSCQYCGSKEEPTFDHVVPSSQGGKTVWENVVLACFPCNQKKGARTPEQAGMRLIKKPVEPKWVPVIALRIRETDPESWRTYLYWNTELVHG